MINHWLPAPDLHRPATPGDLATPPPAVASNDPEQTEAEVAARQSDKLAEEAGVNADVLKMVKEQER